MLNIIFTILIRFFALIIYGISLYIGLGYLLILYVLSEQVSPDEFGPRSKLVISGWFAVTFGLLYLIFS